MARIGLIKKGRRKKRPNFSQKIVISKKIGLWVENPRVLILVCFIQVQTKMGSHASEFHRKSTFHEGKERKRNKEEKRNREWSIRYTFHYATRARTLALTRAWLLFQTGVLALTFGENSDWIALLARDRAISLACFRQRWST